MVSALGMNMCIFLLLSLSLSLSFLILAGSLICVSVLVATPIFGIGKRDANKKSLGVKRERFLLEGSHTVCSALDKYAHMMNTFFLVPVLYSCPRPHDVCEVKRKGRELR
ncbi:hypothetical protein M434DRAFT_264618 [Hypoxylon sp. CO27-5]|nr:hypothetical protein M434DRAFT_264618 [Hypoxylon sp. CO27-5]